LWKTENENETIIIIIINVFVCLTAAIKANYSQAQNSGIRNILYNNNNNNNNNNTVVVDSLTVTLCGPEDQHRHLHS
jgi:hypothetical protein